MTNKDSWLNSDSKRVYSPRDLDVMCPILKIMNKLDLIGLAGVRMTRDDWGQTGYIINIYERFRN